MTKLKKHIQKKHVSETTILVIVWVACMFTSNVLLSFVP